MTSLNNVYCKNPDIVMRRIADETVLIPIRRAVGDLEKLYVLKGAGGYIWDHIDGVASLEQIKALVLDEYEIAPEQAESDLCEFISDIENIGAIKLT